MLVNGVMCVLTVIGSHYVVSLQGLVNSCKTHTDCQAENGLICVDEVCVCNSTLTMHADGQKCVPKVKDGDKCDEVNQCSYSDYTECINGRCKCEPNYKFNGEKCTGSLDLDDACTQDTECQDFDLGIVWCYTKKCSCKNGFKRDGKKCVIGGSCTSDSDCSALHNSFCETESNEAYTCKCKSDFINVASNTNCLPIINQIDVGCKFNEQCTHKLGKAECKNGQCKCTSGAVWNKNTTMCVIGGNCATDEDCKSTENSYCDKHSRTWSMCKCKEGFINVANDTKCLPIAKTLGADCEYDDQCSSKLGKAKCTNSQCNCTSPADFKGNTSPCGDSAARRNVISFICFVLLPLVKIL